MRGGIVLGPLATGCLFLVMRAAITQQCWARKYAESISFGLLLLFIPANVFSALGAFRLIDWIDTREIHYSQASEMVGRVRYHIPPTAGEIDFYRRGFGHVARFAISSGELTKWVEELKASKPELNSNLQGEETKSIAVSSALFNADFSTKSFPTADWKFETNMQFYTVTVATNGGGFNVWYAPDSQIAYLREFYW